MSVSCIIPAYNEAARIRRVITAARACEQVDEVVVVSDGSTDDTVAAAAAAGADRVIPLAQNQGKGAAVLAAVEEARGEVLLLLDADLYGIEPGHLTELLAPVLSGLAEMAVGIFTSDLRHGLLPVLSGQRALRRGLLEPREALAGSGFGLELRLDRTARAQGACVVHVPLAGVHHRRKRQKYGAMRGFRQEIRASSDLLREFHVTGGARRRSQPAGRGAQSMEAFLALALLFLLLAPIFLTTPSHASRLPEQSLLQPGDRLLAVVAHPDDEVIGLGGLIVTARGLGVPVRVILLTNGDSNRVSAALLARRSRPRPADFINVGMVRQRETLEGLRRLGIPPGDVDFLGFPDRRLSEVLASVSPVTSPFTRLDHAAYTRAVGVNTPYTGAAMQELMERLITGFRPTLIVTHAPFDQHPDHRAAYTLVAPRRGEARLYTFLVHARAFPRPLRSAPRQPLLPPADLAEVPGWSWIEFTLSQEAEGEKRQAIDAHRSQISSPYLRFLLASFVRPNELFAVPRDPTAVSLIAR
ncbi:MAG TPA: PIG-L family deacetylase [bacterium]|jgi:LmbE family N-acetylglucosaminyl deacetylase|nr:PIG-L family deacetylase [bacterium]